VETLGAPARPGAEQLHRSGREPPERNARNGLARQLADRRPQRMVGAHPLVPPREDEQCAGALHAPAQELDQVEGRIVGPVEILDDDDGRRLGGAQLFEEGLEDVLARGSRRNPSGELATPLRPGDVEEGRERPWRRERVASAPEQLRIPRMHTRELRQQRRLADAGLAVDERDPAVPAASARQQIR